MRPGDCILVITDNIIMNEEKWVHSTDRQPLKETMCLYITYKQILKYSKVLAQGKETNLDANRWLYSTDKQI